MRKLGFLKRQLAEGAVGVAAVAIDEVTLGRS